MISDQTLYNSKRSCPSCRAIARPHARFCTQCGRSFERPRVANDGERMQAGAGEMTKEIAFNELHASDNILILTANSTYRFAVTDPMRRRGFLSGGALADYMEDATLVGVLVENHSGFMSDTSGLRTESCALFFIKEGNGFKRLTTSIITNLVHIKNSETKTLQFA